jgi:dTDP-4-amino-4,6-dideoxygalactose transaminase
MDEILGLARSRGAAVISDASHAIGATYKGRAVGSVADMTVFSFHPVKHITTGEGGMVLTDSDEFARRLRLFRTHGITNDAAAMSLPGQSADKDGGVPASANPDTRAPWYYEMQVLGFNFRITDLQCALGLSQFRRLDANLERRRVIAGRYDAAFQDNPLLAIPVVRPGRESAWHLYVLRLRLERMKRTRRQVFEVLRAAGIGVQVHYIPVHLQPYYRGLGHGRGECPHAEAFYDAALTVPLFPAMKDDEISAVIEAVTAAVA